MTTADLPALNALLNGTAAVLLVIGRVLIRSGRRAAHQKVMLAALSVSAAFLASYLVYHLSHGSRRFQGPADVRAVYLVILLTHTVLAAVNVPLVVLTVFRALTGRFEPHRRIARWAWAVWLYVSVTGVVIYVMLYQLWPAPPPVG